MKWKLNNRRGVAYISEVGLLLFLSAVGDWFGKVNFLYRKFLRAAHPGVLLFLPGFFFILCPVFNGATRFIAGERVREREILIRVQYRVLSVYF